MKSGSLAEQFILNEMRQSPLFTWAIKMPNDMRRPSPCDIDARGHELSFYIECKSTFEDSKRTCVNIDKTFKRQASTIHRFWKANPIRHRGGFIFAFHQNHHEVMDGDLLFYVQIAHISYIIEKVCENPDVTTRQVSGCGLTKTMIRKDFFFKTNLPKVMESIEFQIYRIPLLRTEKGRLYPDLSVLVDCQPYRPYLNDGSIETMDMNVLTKKYGGGKQESILDL